MTAFIASLIKQKIAGKLAGLLVSKTQWGASAIAGASIWASLPLALAGNAEAVGIVTITVFGWLMALYGRLKARFA